MLCHSATLSAQRAGFAARGGTRAVPHVLSHGAAFQHVSSSASNAAPVVCRRAYSCGIIGLPNIGKSSLFNALTRTQIAQSANFPFCTIDPNTAKVAVPDPMLDRLSEVYPSEKVTPSQIGFVDIAGLVKGAHQGAGLGNQFLGNIRPVDVTLQVLRCWDGGDIVHVEASVDPVRDMDIIETELLLADMQMMENRMSRKASKKGSGGVVVKEAVMKEVHDALSNSIPIHILTKNWKEEELAQVQQLQLLTAKPMLYVCNVDDASLSIDGGNDLERRVKEEVAKRFGDEYAEERVLRICSALEEDALSFEDQEAQREYIAMAHGLDPSEDDVPASGLYKVVTAVSSAMSWHKFYTVGPTEARSWVIPLNTTAVEAAGKIHSDMQKGFIKVDVIKPHDLLELGGENEVKAKGRLKQMGRDYVVEDSDVLMFRFN